MKSRNEFSAAAEIAGTKAPAPARLYRHTTNPLGAIGSVGAMLEYSFGLKDEARAVDAAIEAVLESGKVTADLRPAGTPATTEEVGAAVCAAI